MTSALFERVVLIRNMPVVSLTRYASRYP